MNFPQPIRFSRDQKAQFERDGFLIVRGALSPDEIAQYTGIVDGLAEDERREKSLAADATIEIRNAIARDAALLPLLDHPLALGAMLDILGWNIQLTTSHVFVRPATPAAQASFKAIDWHRDGPAPGGFPIVNGALPRMYAKIGYFLTDLSEPDRGNLRVVPGSHLHAERPQTDPETGELEGAIQVLTQPGDAVLFENRTLHAVGPNYAGTPRKNIYIGYCHRYLKAIDFLQQSPELLAQANPIQRQLLGSASNHLSFYLPGRYEADVPLKALA